MKTLDGLTLDQMITLWNRIEAKQMAGMSDYAFGRCCFMLERLDAQIARARHH